MYLLYIDESGVSNIPGNTSHFILTGISVPIWHWKDRINIVEEMAETRQNADRY